MLSVDVKSTVNSKVDKNPAVLAVTKFTIAYIRMEGMEQS